VTITITDHGDWRPERRAVVAGGHRGNGLAMMRACTAEMRLVRSARGTTVTLVSNNAPATDAPPTDAPQRNAL
jgi:anti-sigma regulatory factor (Ser/Thr protein kinase)